MHEVSIVEGLLGIISQQKEQKNFRRVITIEMIAGPYNCVSEDNLDFCFKAATEDNPLFKGSAINIIRLPQRYLCRGCEKEFSAEGTETLPGACPLCHSSKITPRVNSELYLNKLEVE